MHHFRFKGYWVVFDFFYSNFNWEVCKQTIETMSALFAFVPVKCFYWPFQGGTSFVDHLFYLCFVFVMLLRLFIAAF